VYGFIAIDTNYFSPDSNWAAVGKNSAGYQCYKVSSVLTDTTKTTASKIITIGNAIGKAVTINLKTTDSYVSWKVNSTTVTSQTAYNGDTLERSGTSLICKDQSGVTR
jgi:ABC-type molybdenum transport system ATPase subunit/photorepair protein PhrA